MAQEPNRYYRPYMSDSDASDSDDDTASTTSSLSSGSNNQPNYRQFASNLRLVKAAGPNFSTNEDQILFQNPKTMDPYVSDTSGVSIPKLTSTKTLITSVVMLSSRDRDINVFPQPTNLTLRLPRTYKNITNFQILQINLLSSFFYFSANKNNLTLIIQEQGRYVQDQYGLIKNALNSTLYETQTSIREGTYNIDTLITELNLQLNRTPIFYDYINGIQDFAPKFTTSGDYSLNFNQPGDTFFDAVNNVFITNPTMTQIIQKYFQTTFAGLTSYSIEQIKVAYYYPVLKELLLDPAYGSIAVSLLISDISTLQEDITLTLAERIFSRCIYTFQGLDDLVVQQVINLNNNITILDTYRLKHTFRYSLINKYIVSYSQNSNRITISSSSLNTSLLILLSNKYNYYYGIELTKNSLTIEQYNAISTINTLLLAVITDMYDYIQTQLAIYFGVNYNTYALVYFTNKDNQLFIQNGLDSTGIAKVFSLSSRITPYLTNSLLKFDQQDPHYWTNLTNLENILDYVDPNTNPYNIVSDTIDTDHTFTNNNGIIYQNPILKSVNMIATINPERYTVFTFKSFARQTLRITTLPRPTKYRYLEYNQTAYSSAINTLFDISYAFIDNLNINKLPPNQSIRTIPGFSSGDSSFGIQLADSTNLWTNVTPIQINPNNTAQYLTFVTPTPPTVPGIYKYTLNLSIIQTSVINTTLFLYHDRGAFIADVTDARNEKPIHYIGMWPNITNTSTISFTVYANHTYFILIRSTSPLVNGVQKLIIVPYFSSTTYKTISSTIPTLTNWNLANPSLNLENSNYAFLADPDFLRLPTIYNQANKDLSGSYLYAASKQGIDSNFPSFAYSISKIGYDSNNISSDLTDYFGFTTLSNCVPNSLTRFDPISQCVFTITTSTYYNSTTSTYLNYSNAFGNGNSVVAPFSTLSYITPTTYQSVIAHWYSHIFIPNTANQPYIYPSAYTISSNVNNDTTITLKSYPYVQDILYSPIFSNPTSASLLQGYSFQNKQLSLGDGIIGISFIPEDGVWDVNRIMLRSAYIKSGKDGNGVYYDPNRNIQYLGIFPSAYLNTLLKSQIALSNALMIFTSYSNVTYQPGDQYDIVGGTYYEWLQASHSQYIYGYTQTPGKIIADSNAYYSIVPFDANSNLTTYSLISGSLVPYPAYSDGIAAPAYLDGTTTPTGAYLIKPVIKTAPDLTQAPPKGFDQTQSKYEQSIPIGSTLLQYLKPPDLVSVNNALHVFDLSNSALINLQGPVPFTDIYFRVADYILYDEDGDYSIYKYDNNTSRRIFYPNSYESSLSVDMFFTNYLHTQLVGISGNNSIFAFLGLQATPYQNGYEYTLIIESFNPVTQQINSICNIVLTTKSAVITPTGMPGTSTYPLCPDIIGNKIINVDSFNYNDNGGFTFVIQYNIGGIVKTIGITKGSPIDDVTFDALPFIFVESLPAVSPVLPTTIQILQSPYEPFGRFYIAAKTAYDIGTSVTSLGSITASVLTFSAATLFVGWVITSTGITSLTTVTNVISSNKYTVSGTTTLTGSVLITATPPYNKPTNLKYSVREPMIVNEVVRSANPNYIQNGLFFVDPNSKFDTTQSDVQTALSSSKAPSIYSYSSGSYSKTTTIPSIVRINLNSSTPAIFGDITLLQNPYENRIILYYDMYDMLINNGIPSVTYYEVTSFTATSFYITDSTYTPSRQLIKATNTDTVLCPYQIRGGGGGSFWILYNEANNILPSNPLPTYSAVWGNRGDSTDFPIGVGNAYQIFYPTQRIVMTKVLNTYNPLTDISGILYPEYPHTAVFAYDSIDKLKTDIQSQWGFESTNNYISADFALSNGYYFNACDFDIPLSSNVTYYIALRGYSPTERSQVMMRFSLPNRHDFGYITIKDLSNEIPLSKISTNAQYFNSNYTNLIQQFDSNFVFTSKYFGANIIEGYTGSNITNIVGFGDFIRKYNEVYTVYNQNTSLIQTITTNTKVNIQKFISSDLAAIIPASASARQRYTDPLTYSILWKSGISSQYASLTDNWGLGWNLGYNKVDSDYLTTHVAQSFYKILDDYINLRLNPEFNLNNIDTSSKENLQITKDTTGSTKTYYGKLLLNSFGLYSQTMISNPIVFQIPVPKVDKLTFIWYDNVGGIINNNDCEWTAVVQIVEQLDIVTPSE